MKRRWLPVPLARIRLDQAIRRNIHLGPLAMPASPEVRQATEDVLVAEIMQPSILLMKLREKGHSHDRH